MAQVKNWAETKEALLEGLTGSKREIVGTLMENQRALYETATPLAVTAGSIGDFPKMAIPMIRRIIPGTIATELVGVQPMTGPVGLVYSMRFIYAENVDAQGPSTVAANDIIGQADEAFNLPSKMKRFYSSANVGTTHDYESEGYPPKLLAETSDGFASKTADYEGFGGRHMRLGVAKSTVTVGTRKLQARWTVEAQQDMSSQHGLDLESELTAALSAQIAHEIDNEILTDLLALAGTVATVDLSAPLNGYSPTFLGDRYAQVGVLINALANTVGAKTRRGAANWAVGSHLITSVLQSASKSVFAPAVSGTFSDPTGNRMVGVMNGAMRVYSYNWGLNDAWDPFATGAGAANATGLGEDILIGYKGGNSELDAGYFYCPYQPLMSSGPIMDNHTFMPAISLMTRYGKATFTDSATSLGNSQAYYARLFVKGVSFS